MRLIDTIDIIETIEKYCRVKCNISVASYYEHVSYDINPITVYRPMILEDKHYRHGLSHILFPLKCKADALRILL